MHYREEQGTGDRDRYIRVGWMVDGSGAPPQKDILMHIRCGKIAAFKAYAGEAVDDPFDLKNCTVIPPLVDCHTHMTLSGTEDLQARQDQLSDVYPAAASRIERNLDTHARYGILAVRDGGDRNGYTHRYGQEKIRHAHHPVLLRTVRCAVRKIGRYGKMIADPVYEGMDPAVMLGKAIAGGDHVKVLNSGVNSLLEYARKTDPQFTAAEMDRLVKSAAAMGYPVMVHANGRDPVRFAVEAGCASLEHGYFMGKENLKRMADRQVVWVPTIVPISAYGAILAPGSKEYETAARTVANQLEQLHHAKKAGVRVAVGTDAGGIGVHHGISVYQEICLLLAGGYKVEEAVRSASTEGARLVGVDGKVALSSGNSAMFLAVDGPPSRLREKFFWIRRYNESGFQAPIRVKTAL